MVRAGVVKHPSEWKTNGYNEIMHPPDRYALIDQIRLQTILGFSNSETMGRTYSQLLYQTLQNNSLQRQKAWSESIAVGNEDFITETKRKLTSSAIGRDVHERDGVVELREPYVSYNAHFDPKKHVLSPENTYLWNINNNISMS